MERKGKGNNCGMRGEDGRKEMKRVLLYSWCSWLRCRAHTGANKVQFRKQRKIALQSLSLPKPRPFFVPYFVEKRREHVGEKE